MNAMVQGHEEVANTLRPWATRAEVVGTTGGEHVLAQWAAKMMPVVEEHLRRAREIERKVD
jgi:hypothetical protein